MRPFVGDAWRGRERPDRRSIGLDRGAAGRRVRGAGVAVVLATLALSGCVGSSRTDEDYAKKAVATADAVRSAIETARLGVDAADRGRAFSPYLSRLFGDAEGDGAWPQTAFDSVQPPSEAADAIRRELDELLDEASTVLSEVRIAMRRNDIAGVVDRGDDLAALSSELEAFSDRYGA